MATTPSLPMVPFISSFQPVLRQACWLRQSTLAGDMRGHAGRLCSSEGRQTLTLIQCHGNAAGPPSKNLQVFGLAEQFHFPGEHIPTSAPPIDRGRYTAAFSMTTSPDDVALECIDVAETKHENLGDRRLVFFITIVEARLDLHYLGFNIHVTGI
ncbi:hypothetical protein CSUB01_05338 [Colletotrichum sublineola]|uniref:Uncharacterized protein n=1 Tax=Colletotrichum sublineola TaxID=1173701 RepID=A0A066XUI3_COLSU|nr:hypothetical protein CSUB01_05338 [Colletotrichum sublineola]